MNERRWAEGCHNAAQLWRELCERGYDSVRRWAIRRRGRETAAIDQERPLPSWRVPSSRRAARLLTAPAETLTPTDRQFVATLTALSPEIRIATEAVTEFARILRERDAAAFETWLTAAQTTALRGFVARDHRRYRGRSGRPVAALEQWSRRGPSQPAEDAEAADVRPCQIRPTAQPCSFCCVITSPERGCTRGIQPAPKVRKNPVCLPIDISESTFGMISQPIGTHERRSRATHDRDSDTGYLPVLAYGCDEPINLLREIV
jgi:hypothetical protein